MNKNNSLPIHISPEALQAILSIMQKKQIGTEYGLRIGIRGNACAGQNFLLGFDKPKPSDEQYQLDHLAIYIDKKHFMYILGLELNYEQAEDGSKGFVFHNPNPFFKSK